jgi:hypothetical protein
MKRHHNDLNNDGFKEIIGPTDTHYITAPDRNGNQLSTNAIYGRQSMEPGVHGIKPPTCAATPTAARNTGPILPTAPAIPM